MSSFNKHSPWWALVSIMVASSCSSVPVHPPTRLSPFKTVEVAIGPGHLAVYVYQAEEFAGLVILGHGYLEHGQRNVGLIQAALDKGYAVITWDLPGHGQSSGERGAIASFAEYASSVARVVEFAQAEYANLPWIFIGHSTACAAWMEWERSLGPEEEQPFDKVIFIAPLVRSWLYGLSGLGYVLGKPFLTHLRPRTDVASHDPAVGQGFFADPLNIHSMPVSWVPVHREWERTTRTWTPRKTPLVIFQGTADTALDWRYNLAWFSRTYPRSTVHHIKGAKHNLQDEIPKYSTQLFALLFDLL